MHFAMGLAFVGQSWDDGTFSGKHALSSAIVFFFLLYSLLAFPSSVCAKQILFPPFSASKFLLWSKLPTLLAMCGLCSCGSFPICTDPFPSNQLSIIFYLIKTCNCYCRWLAHDLISKNIFYTTVVNKLAMLSLMWEKQNWLIWLSWGAGKSLGILFWVR